MDVDERLHTDGVVNVLEERLDQPPAWHVVLAIAGLALSLLGAVLVASASDETEPAGAGSTAYRSRAPGDRLG